MAGACTRAHGSRQNAASQTWAASPSTALSIASDSPTGLSDNLSRRSRRPEKRLVGCTDSSYKHEGPRFCTHPSGFNPQYVFSLDDITRNSGIDLAASFRVRFTDVFEPEPDVSETHTDIALIGVFGQTEVECFLDDADHLAIEHFDGGGQETGAPGGSSLGILHAALTAVQALRAI